MMGIMTNSRIIPTSASHAGKESSPDSSIYTLVVRAKSRALHFDGTEIRLGISPSENDIKFEQKS
jgi:hypothetical protein